MRVEHLYISTGHNFFGHHGMAAGEHPAIEVPRIDCVAGRGICGDRFFDYKKDYRGQITFFSREVYEGLCEALDVWDKPPSVFRRNVVVSGVDLNELVGQDFAVQGVQFHGERECSPCHWMNTAFGPGAEAWLKGRGGLRARILSDGVLTAG